MTAISTYNMPRPLPRRPLPPRSSPPSSGSVHDVFRVHARHDGHHHHPFRENRTIPRQQRLRRHPDLSVNSPATVKCRSGSPSSVAPKIIEKFVDAPSMETSPVSPTPSVKSPTSSPAPPKSGLGLNALHLHPQRQVIGTGYSVDQASPPSPTATSPAPVPQATSPWKSVYPAQGPPRPAFDFYSVRRRPMYKSIDRR